MSLSEALTFAQAVESATKALAVVFAGVWTYLLFVQHRQRYPQAALTHAVTPLPVADGYVVLHVAVRIQNVGKVLIELESGFVRVYHVLPAAPDVLAALSAGAAPPTNHQEFPWPHLAEIPLPAHQEVEPGEAEELHFEFALPRTVRTVQVYTHLANKTKRRRIGWNCTTIHDLNPPPPR